MNTTQTVKELKDAAYQTPEKRAFYRRRSHSNITAQTGRILQALGYPGRKLRDLVDAIQSAHGAGQDAETPHTPFARSHLTLAGFMDLRGKPESNVAVVSRSLAAHKKWQRANGYTLIDVLSPSDDNEIETTTYIDHLTPIADESFQRALSSDLWKKDKRKAIEESVKWALAQIPWSEPEPERESDGAPEMALADYSYFQALRLAQSAEKVGDRISNEYHADEEAERFFRELGRDFTQKADSIRKTRRARFAQIEEPEEAEAEYGAAERVVNTNTMHAVFDPPADPATDEDAPGGGHAKQSTPTEPKTNEDKDLNFQEITLEPEPEPDMGAWALGYLKLGFAVFPLHSVGGDGKCDCGDGKCGSPGKHPRTRTGVKEASKDPDQIRAWWRRWPSANIGIATGAASGIAVMDVDFKSGGDSGLGDLTDRIGDLPDTYTVKTGNGWHFYFAGEIEGIRNSQGKVGEGLDVRGEGGYVVAPPSRHYSGKRYEQVSEFLPAPIPSALRELVLAEPARPKADPLKPARSKVATPQFSDLPTGLRDGDGRNTLLFRKVACRARFFGDGESEILDKLREANSKHCADPLSDSELGKIARSATRYAPGVSR